MKSFDTAYYTKLRSAFPVPFSIQAQVVDRVRILLLKAQGQSFQAIADKLDVTVKTVQLCISKYKNGGIDEALFDHQRSGRPPEISDDAKAWIISTACQRPAELGYAQELWTLKNLHAHIQRNTDEADYPRLSFTAIRSCSMTLCIKRLLIHYGSCPLRGNILAQRQWRDRGEKFFLPVRVRSKVFRGKYMGQLKRLWKEERLGNHRIISMTEDKVTFSVKDYRHEEEMEIPHADLCRVCAPFSDARSAEKICADTTLRATGG